MRQIEQMMAAGISPRTGKRLSTRCPHDVSEAFMHILGPYSVDRLALTMDGTLPGAIIVYI